MRRHLLWLLLCANLGVQSLSAHYIHPFLLCGNERAQWNMTIERGSMLLTAICIVRQTEEGVVGSVVNEFGLRAFDFLCKNNKVKVFNVMPMMNRWYIRKVLCSDLKVLTADRDIKLGRKRKLDLHLPDSMTLYDNRYGITYHFEQLADKTDP